MITSVLNAATRKGEGPKRNTPCSEEKVKQKGALHCWKMKARQMSRMRVNEDQLKRMEDECSMNVSKIIALELAKELAKEELENSIKSWKEMKVKGKELREHELLDCCKPLIAFENADLEQQKKNVIEGMKRSMAIKRPFSHITKHVGRGERSCLKRVHIVDSNNQTIDAKIRKEEIEEETMKHNTHHYKMAIDAPVYEDKICKNCK